MPAARCCSWSWSLLPIPLVMAALATGYWISLAFSNPLQQRMWGAMYPAAERGRLIGFVSTGKAAAAGMALLVGGILADRIGGMVVVAFAGAIGALCAMAASRIQAPLDPDARRFSAHESWAAFRRRPALRQVAAAQAFYGAGLIAAGPLYALVQVDRLSLSMAEIGLIGILGAVAATLSCLAWGSMADRRGSVSVMRIGSGAGPRVHRAVRGRAVGHLPVGWPRSSWVSPTRPPTWASRRSSPSRCPRRSEVPRSRGSTR